MTTLHLLAMAPQQGGNPEGGLFSTLIMFAMIIAIFYFLILRPQQKRQKERQAMMGALKKGDRIVTAGGIHGSIVGVEEKTLLVQIADNLKVKIDRTAVASVIREAEAAMTKDKS